MTTNADRKLYFQSVPMFLVHGPRILALTERNSTMLDAQLATDCFNAGENLLIAQVFVLRTIFPVIALLHRSAGDKGYSSTVVPGKRSRQPQKHDTANTVDPQGAPMSQDLNRLFS